MKGVLLHEKYFLTFYVRFMTFMDAMGQFPDQPNFPVIWLIKGKGQVPWGNEYNLIPNNLRTSI